MFINFFLLYRIEKSLKVVLTMNESVKFDEELITKYKLEKTSIK